MILHKIKMPFEVGLSFCFGTDQGRRKRASGVRILELSPHIKGTGNAVPVQSESVWESGHAAALIKFDARWWVSGQLHAPTVLTHCEKYRVTIH